MCGGTHLRSAQEDFQHSGDWARLGFTVGISGKDHGPPAYHPLCPSQEGMWDHQTFHPLTMRQEGNAQPGQTNASRPKCLCQMSEPPRTPGGPERECPEEE